MTRHCRSIHALILCSLISTGVAHAQASVPAVARLAQLDAPLGQAVPTGLAFADVDNRSARLDAHLGGKPGVLVLAYARCSLLCNVVLQSLANAVSGLDGLAPGRDFRMAAVSIDPKEPADLAARKQATLLERIGYSGARWRWPYLRGSEQSIAALASAIGFRYAWDARTSQYAHPAVVFVLTPDNRVARRLSGLEFGASELAQAIRDAGRSSVGAADSTDIMRCFRFEPGARRYSQEIQAYFRIGGLFILLALVSMIVGLLLWERRRA